MSNIIISLNISGLKTEKIAKVMLMNSMNMIVRQAMEFGAKAHAEQLDDAGNDYFKAHCCQVYEIVKYFTLMTLNCKRLPFFMIP
jgi:hypothetical protein